MMSLCFIISCDECDTGPKKKKKKKKKKKGQGTSNIHLRFIKLICLKKCHFVRHTLSFYEARSIFCHFSTQFTKSIIFI